MPKAFDVKVFNPSATRDRDEIQNIVPTFFIGLGGTGNNVLMEMRRKFYHAGQSGLQRDFVRYLMIDTDSRWWPRSAEESEFRAVRPTTEERIDCEITSEEFINVFDRMEKMQDPLFADWLKPDLRDLGPSAVSDGAGTWRPFGRMAFMLNYHEIRKRIERNLQHLVREASRGGGEGVEVQQSHLEVVIVTSFAGGTGAGMYIDIAYLVKDVLRSMRETSSIAHKYTFMIGVMPQAFEGVVDPANYEKFKRNAYACLLELEHYGAQRSDDELILGRIKEHNRRLGAGFKAPWLDETDNFIEGAGWEACYLIDNANPLTVSNPLSLDETTQMIADYLYLDFQTSSFAVEKRSNRSNLRQFQEDRIEIQVRNPAADSVQGMMQDTDVVYACQNSCTFSSFGLAQVSFNTDRVYRAASYLLANELVRQRWDGEGSTHLPDSSFEAFAKVDLFAPEATSEQRDPPSFSLEKLAERLYTTNDNKSWLRTARREYSEASSLAPEDGYEGLRTLNKKHDAAVSAQGPAFRNVQEQALRLEGTTHELGPLRERLRAQTRARVIELGVRHTIRLVDSYDQCLNEIVNKASSLSENRESAASKLLRLEEAGEVWFPGRLTAQRIEFPLAWKESDEYNNLRYNRAAADAVRSLALTTLQYLGDENAATVPDSLQDHGTIRATLRDIHETLTTLQTRLVGRFNEHIGAKGSDRAQTLIPWQEQQPYVDLVRRAMVKFATLKTPEGEGVDWRKVEAEVLRLLQEDGVARATSVWDLHQEWVRTGATTEDGTNEFAEKLAKACRSLLDSTTLDLSSFSNGAAIDILYASPPSAREEIIRNLVTFSAPNLSLDVKSHAAMAKKEPVFDCLVGQKIGDTPEASQKNQERLIQDLTESIQHHNDSPNLEGTLKAIPSADPTSIILSREVWAVPLQYYSFLDDLYKAYEAADKEKPKLHLSWRHTWEDLPDIRPIKPAIYEHISQNVENVLYGMLLGRITCDDGETYEIRVDDPIMGVRVFKLGTRIGRIIKKACEEQATRDFLKEKLREWELKATPKQWASVFASTIKTYEDLKQDIEHEGDKKSSPLSNCFRSLWTKFRGHLETTDEGRMWLDLLSVPREDDPQAKKDEVAELYRTLVEQKVLFRTSPLVPIYEVDFVKAESVLTLPSGNGSSGTTKASAQQEN